MPSPVISVVMTAFNSGRFIGETIDSLLNQTFSDFELIIVDDGSTDNTCDIIKSYADERIIFIQNKQNIGQTKSLNIGIKGSRGLYIARIDADDVALPERFAIQVQYLKDHPEIDVVGSAGYVINEQGKVTGKFSVPADHWAIKCYLLGSGDLSYYVLYHPTVMIRRGAMEAVGFYEERQEAFKGYPQDYELWFKMLPRSQFANIQQPLLKYRIVRKSDSRGFLSQSMQFRFNLTLGKIKQFMPNLDKQDAIILANMLEFRPQNGPEDGRKVFNIFDLYFESAVKIWGKNSGCLEYRDALKYYYLPQLFKTNVFVSLLNYFSFIGQRPYFLFDLKFYRKIIKAIAIKI